MRVCFKVYGLLLAVCFGLATITVPATVQAQEKERHVVSQQELNGDAAHPAETRQANEAAVRHLLSSEAGKQALKTADADYQKVDKAIGQLNDDDLAKLAQRSRQAENDFAAGNISAKQLAYIILIIVVVVVIIVLV